jgi:hypothetical protein
MSHRHVSNTITAKCPACDTVGKIESMPIFRDEQYTFEHHKSYGIVLDFFPAQKKKKTIRRELEKRSGKKMV